MGIIESPPYDSPKRHKALFLDRDGVIIDYIPYLSKPEQVCIPVGAGNALKQWQDQGYLLLIVTNQSGVGRGYFTLQDVEAVHSRIRQEYLKFGVYFQDMLVCPHHPEAGCQCRKPSPYLLQVAAKQYCIEISQSFYIGDALSDINCAIRAGCTPILLLTGLGKMTVQTMDITSQKIHLFNNLSETVCLI